MGKTENVIDLKTKPTKISEDQLTQLQGVVNDNNAIQYRIGSLETQKHVLLHEFAKVQDSISKLQSELSKEYGTFDVDLKDGSINYPDNG